MRRVRLGSSERLARRVDRNGKHLSKMMLEVPDIVKHEVVERRCLGSWNSPPRDLIEVVLRVRAQSHILGNRCHHVREVAVVGCPQGDQIRP